jgi:gluconokinase
MWFRREQPEVFARTATWLSFSDYVSLRLSGDMATSVSMASATGIFDQRKCTWDDELARFLKIKQKQLPVIRDGSDHFRLNRSFSRRWPRLASAKWFPAIGDGAANNIGSGCVTKHRAALMSGTSGAMRIAYKAAPPNKIPDGLWCYRIDSDRVIVGGALSDGGGLYNWLEERLRSPKSVDAIISKRRPAPHGLTFLPFIAGERSTGYHEDAAGAVIGMTATTDAVDVIEAAMEAVAFRFAEVADQLGEVAEFDEIIASGGALRNSKVWTSLIADVLSRALHFVRVSEASLRGAVLLALETLGNIESIEEISPGKCKVFEPNPTHFAVYQRARREHKRYYDLIIKNT